MTTDSALVTLLLGCVVGFLWGYAQAWYTACKLERLSLKPSDWHAFGSREGAR